MAKTIIQGFDYTYPHIESPTVQSKELTNTTGKYTLIHEPYLDEHYATDGIAALKLHPWTAKRKFDGANIRIKWDGEQALVAGKTNNFNLGGYPGLEKYVEEHLLEEMFESTLGREKTFYLFGEFVGPKIQNNELHLDYPELVLFDVKIENGVWLQPKQVMTIAEKLHLPHFESEGYGHHIAEASCLQQLIDRVRAAKYDDWEGIVAEPVGGLLDRQGHRIICKIKNKYYNW